MPVDKWGIKFFYPSKKTMGLTTKTPGFFWQQNNDIHKDDDYEGSAMVRIGKEHDSSDFKVIDSTTGEWQFPFNFDSGDGLSLSGPTGHHTGGVSHGCQGFTYMINVDLEANPPKFRFRKETFHVQYDNHPEGLWTHPAAPDKIVGGGWFGYGWVRYNKKDGRGKGKDSVICEAWWNNDPEADINNWVMLKRVEDLGDGKTNWGVGATCSGDAHQVGTWSNIQFRFKVDASDFSLHPLKPEPDNGPNINSIGGEKMSFSDSEARGYGYRADMPRDIEMKCLFRFNDTSGKCRFKNVSLREIDPGTDFTDPDNPEPPIDQPATSQTIKGTFKLQRNINVIGNSLCAPAGLNSFYLYYTNIPSGAADEYIFGDSSLTDHIRIGAWCKTSASSMFGKILKQLDIKLKKVGSPSASPSIVARIYNADLVLKATSVNTIDPSALTTSFDIKSFDFSTNTYQFQTGDRLIIEYTGTSDVNYVVGQNLETAPADGTDTQFTYYDNGTGGWANIGTQDFAAQMWE